MNFVESVTSLAAVLCICWSCFSSVLLGPQSSELHVSNLEVMSTLICFQICPMFLIDTHTALDTLAMCLSMERFSSTITPRFVTLSVGVTMVLPTLII